MVFVFVSVVVVDYTHKELPKTRMLLAWINGSMSLAIRKEILILLALLEHWRQV